MSNLSPVRLLFIHKTIKCMDTISNSHQTCSGLHFLSQQDMFCCLLTKWHTTLYWKGNFHVSSFCKVTWDEKLYHLSIANFQKKIETLLPKTIKIQLCLFDLLLKMLEILFYQTHTHTRLTSLCPRLPGWAATRKVKPISILLKQETVSGSSISWAICKSTPRSRQINHSSTPPPCFLQARCPSCRPPNQQRQSTEGSVCQSNSAET